ncbi:L-fucokinase [Lachnospiraceae bacterium 62-35]
MEQNYFFAQSYSDALNDYLYSCRNAKAERWDWIVLTAANDRQTAAYRLQIEMRKEQGRLPKATKFIVITDYQNKRIGSGGATLNVIRVLADKISIGQLLKEKILVIHSGGDSKRIPQYSACGKLFAPVPRMLPSGYVSTIFDELIIAATDIPNRCGNGMMIFPSDTELLFNSLQLDLISCDAAGLSMKAPVLVGQEHGVFIQGKSSSDHRNRDVAWFLHKQSASILNSYGAVDNSNQIDVDTGCIWFGTKLIKELYGLISINGVYNQELFNKFVNSKVCLNFYADFVYPLAENSTLEEFYKESPENGFSDELRECRKIIFERLHPFRLSLVKLVPARYIHFGMTHEMNELFVNNIEKYSYLGWRKRLFSNAVCGTVINTYVSSNSILPNSVYIEDSIISNSKIGENTILSNVDIEGITLPANIVLHGLKLKNDRFVCRIYGKYDNPKSSSSASFLNGSISDLLNRTGISPEEIWGKTTASIWNARIYPECDSMINAVKTALIIYQIISGEASKENIEDWKSSIRHSLNSSYNEADVSEILRRQCDIRNRVKIENFVSDLNNGRDMAETIESINADPKTVIGYVKQISAIADGSEFPQNMRLYLACADMCKKFDVNNRDYNYIKYEDLAYKVVREMITKETFARFSVDCHNVRAVKKNVIVELPVRVNFCGSPSDAAPYCLEYGGTMIDGALLLKGKRPIKVSVSLIPEKEIRFGSFDQGCAHAFHDITKVHNCSNPFDPYALHKAVLAATGIIPLDVADVTLESLCEQFGGGLEILTDVDVPKGSGLGTSSIISAAAVKAVNELFGIDVTNEMIYAQVFLVEQLMTTGGGWQDQVGGLTKGIKYFTTLPGAYQDIQVDILDIPQSTMKELNDRFALIFSGQRRLARNVLREEMNQSIRNNVQSLEALKKIQEYCAILRYYLLKGDITSFAKYISAQFELVKSLDKGASNTCIEYIFDVCKDLIDGKSICGAGGGGFLQVILKKGVTKDDLKQRIQENFLDCGVEVWDSEFI